MAPEKQESEADRNFAAFQRMLPELLANSPGRFVVLHDGELVETFDTFPDAVKYGASKFGRENFSIQEVTSKSASIGFYAYAFS